MPKNRPTPTDITIPITAAQAGTSAGSDGKTVRLISAIRDFEEHHDLETLGSEHGARDYGEGTSTGRPRRVPWPRGMPALRAESARIRISPLCPFASSACTTRPAARGNGSC